MSKDTARKTELELDHCFWNAISSNAAFQAWFLKHTKFAHLALELVIDEKWHQRWYRDPITKKDSEGDILLMFKAPNSTDRYAIHLENKPSHRIWETFQAENYRKRAIDRMSKWRYVDYELALIAPDSFIERSSSEMKHFDLAISYEEIGKFVPEFAAACITL
jgi:hypothetical protein